ncbi:MAG: GspH/FimT family pseudopilin [Azonexus sp.]
MARNPYSFESGVTLVELMITLAVLGVLLAIAVPSFNALIASSRVSASTNELLAAMAQSRSEAIRRGQRVVLCIQDPNNPGQCTNAGSWEQGWMAFVDLDRNGTPGAGEDVVLNSPAQGGVSMPAQNGQRTAVYLPSGRVLDPRTIRVCSPSTSLSDNNRARDILLNIAGQPILTQPVVASACPAP